MSQNCPSCGAGNPDSALWCNQCFASFATETAMAPEPLPPAPSLPKPVAPVGSGPELPGSPGISGNWECQVCGTSNLVAENLCATCGTSIFDAFGADQTDLPQIEPRTAMMSAIIPGVGHARVGHGVLGLTLATVVFFCATAAATLASSSQTLAAVFYGVTSVAIWGISILDAGALASGREPLLQGRRITILAGLLVTVIIVQVISQLGRI